MVDVVFLIFGKLTPIKIVEILIINIAIKQVDKDI